MELPKEIKSILDAIPLTDLDKYVKERYLKVTKEVISTIKQSPDGDYIFQADTLAAMQREGW